MQIFKLVDGGHVDKVIGFDTLPNELMKGVRYRVADGFPKHWKTWLKDVGSMGDFYVNYNDPENKDKIVKSEKYKEPVFFVLDYKMVNRDKERWQEIVNFVRRNCDPSIRLLDKFEDMAKSLAASASNQLELEPEEVPVIQLNKTVLRDDGGIVTGADVQVKRRGRPPKKKEEVSVT